MAIDTGRLDQAWASSGNQGTRPVGWFGAGGSAANPNYGGGQMTQIDLNAPVAQAQQNKADLQNLFGVQRGETTDFLNRYSGAIRGQETTSGLAKRIGDEIGLPTLQANAFNAQQSVYNAPELYTKATTGFDVNENQRQRIINQKLSELSPIAQRATDQAQFAQGQVTQRLGYEQRDQERALLPFEKESDMLSQRLAREASSYSQADTNTLNAIIAKMQSGVQISMQEKELAQQLSIKEMDYRNNLEMQKNEQNFTNQQTAEQRKQGNFVGVNGGLYNTTTGSWAVRPPLTNFG